MGHSVSVLNKDQVATEIKSLGEAYGAYESGIKSNCIDGSVIASLTDQEKAEVFQLAGVSNIIHKKKIVSHFSDLASTMKSYRIWR